MTGAAGAVSGHSTHIDKRWCFLNFGFAKTTFEDIAKRANLSRTLLYRIFKDKEAIYQAVFVDWLVSRRPAAKQAAKGPGSPYERLLRVCRLLALAGALSRLLACSRMSHRIAAKTADQRRAIIDKLEKTSDVGW